MLPYLTYSVVVLCCCGAVVLIAFMPHKLLLPQSGDRVVRQHFYAPSLRSFTVVYAVKMRDMQAKKAKVHFATTQKVLGTSENSDGGRP